MSPQPDSDSESESEHSRILRDLESLPVDVEAACLALRGDVDDFIDLMYRGEYHEWEPSHTLELGAYVEIASLFFNTLDAGEKNTAELARRVHGVLEKNMKPAKEAGIASGTAGKSILYTICYNMWYLLIEKIALDGRRPEAAVELVAQFVVDFVAYAKTQPSWSEWTSGSGADDLWLGWFLNDWVGKEPRCSLTSSDADAAKFARTVLLSAYLVRHGYGSWLSHLANSVVEALGHSRVYDANDAERSDRPVLAVRQLLDVAGVQLFCLCCRPWWEMAVPERYRELAKSAHADRRHFNEYAWEYWKANARRIAGDETRTDEVRDAAKAIARRMEEVEGSEWPKDGDD